MELTVYFSNNQLIKVKYKWAFTGNFCFQNPRPHCNVCEQKNYLLKLIFKILTRNLGGHKLLRSFDLLTRLCKWCKKKKSLLASAEAKTDTEFL